MSLIKEETTIHLILICMYILSVYNMSGSVMDTRKQMMPKTGVLSTLLELRDRGRKIYLTILVCWILGLPYSPNKNTGIQFQIKYIFLV